MNSLKKFTIIALAVLGVTITNISPSFAAAFIKYDGVDGESMSSSSDPSNGINLGDPTTRLAALARRTDGAGTLTFNRDQDRASRLLTRWAREGRHFDRLVIYVPSRREQTYIAYELVDVRFTADQISAGGSTNAPSSPGGFSLQFEEIKIDHTSSAR